MSKDSQLFDLARELLRIKEQEAAIRQNRIEVENRILELVDCARGQQTINAGSAKITVKVPSSYVVVDEHAARKELGVEYAGLFREKLSVNVKAYKEAIKDPTCRNVLADIVEERVGKPSVSVTYGEEIDG